MKVKREREREHHGIPKVRRASDRFITHISLATTGEEFSFDNLSLFPHCDYNRTRDERILPIRTSGMIKYEQQGGKVDLKLKAPMIDRFVLRAIVHRRRDDKRRVHQLPACLTRHCSSLVDSYHSRQWQDAGEEQHQHTRNYLSSWVDAKKSPVSNQIRKTTRLNESER